MLLLPRDETFLQLFFVFYLLGQRIWEATAQGASASCAIPAPFIAWPTSTRGMLATCSRGFPLARTTFFATYILIVHIVLFATRRNFLYFGFIPPPHNHASHCNYAALLAVVSIHLFWFPYHHHTTMRRTATALRLLFCLPFVWPSGWGVLLSAFLALLTCISQCIIRSVDDILTSGCRGYLASKIMLHQNKLACLL